LLGSLATHEHVLFMNIGSGEVIVPVRNVHLFSFIGVLLFSNNAVLPEDIDHLISELVDVLSDFVNVVFSDCKFLCLLLLCRYIATNNAFHNISIPGISILIRKG